MIFGLILVLLFGIIGFGGSALITDEFKAEEFLNELNNEMRVEMNKITMANWLYETDINKKTSNQKIEAIKRFNAIQKRNSFNAKKYNWTHFKQINRRFFEKIAIIGTSALTGDDENKYTTVTNNMETIYSSAKVCVGGKCGLELDPDLDKIMSESKNYSELLEAWVNWREASGKRMRKDFITYYTLGNKAAKMNEIPNKKFQSFDDLWLFSWEMPDIKEQMEQLLKQMKPLYEKIHAYVRIKLKKRYPNKMPNDGTIPAHLLGNMWAQNWDNIMNTIEGVDPFSHLTSIDVTDELKIQNYSSKMMFKLSETFFVDLGLERMTNKFWENSIIDKLPKNIVMVCHASAWDFFDGQDFRIKMCTNINMEDLITIHHEMGHIQYYQQYKNQPVYFREGANPGFHEAIGDLLALSVSTPKHLKKIGLLKMDDNRETLQRINQKFQLKMALSKFMFLPFAYIMDKWRWDVFSGKVSSANMNHHWWKLRGQYQGISPPVNRSEKDFDPGAKYHIPASVEYIRYFASHILQFQFHKKLCSFREKNVPLYECDIDGDREAGFALRYFPLKITAFQLMYTFSEMLKKGSSEEWTKQLKDFIGTDKMDVQPMLQYFKPLEEFLDEALRGEKIGWNFNVDNYFDSSKSSAKSSINENIISLFVYSLITTLIRLFV